MKLFYQIKNLLLSASIVLLSACTSLSDLSTTPQYVDVIGNDFVTLGSYKLIPWKLTEYEIGEKIPYKPSSDSSLIAPDPEKGLPDDWEQDKEEGIDYISGKEYFYIVKILKDDSSGNIRIIGFFPSLETCIEVSSLFDTNSSADEIKLKKDCLRPEAEQEKKDGICEKIRFCEDELKKHPDSAELYYYLAASELELGLSDKAITDASRGIELNKDMAVLYCVRGDAYALKELDEKALKDFEILVKLWPAWDPGQGRLYDTKNRLANKKLKLNKDGLPERYPYRTGFNTINEYIRNQIPFNKIEVRNPYECTLLQARTGPYFDYPISYNSDYLLHSKFFKKSKFYMFSGSMADRSIVLGYEIGSDIAIVIENAPQNLNELIRKEDFNLNEFSDQELIDYVYELFEYTRQRTKHFYPYNLPADNELMKVWRNPIQRFSPEVIAKYKSIFDQKEPYILKGKYGILIECYLYIDSTLIKRTTCLSYDGTFEFLDFPIVDAASYE